MSVSRAVARRKLGELVGPYGVFTATGGSTTTVQYTSPFQSSELPSNAFAYQWLYIPATAVVRRITATGLNGTTGTLTADGGLGMTVVLGTIFELSARLPPARDSGANIANTFYLSLNDALNLGARHLLADQDDLAVSLVSGQRDYDLSAYGWLDRSERLVDVRTLDPLGGSYLSTSKHWALRSNGKGSALHLMTPYRFSSGSYSLRLVVKRPADTLIKVGGVTWTETTGGATGDTDEYPLELNQLLPVALVYVYASLRDRNRGPSAARYQALYEQQVREARRVRNYDHSNDIDPSVSGAGAPAGPEGAG